MIQLLHPYPRVQNGDALSYGGNQMLAAGKNMQQCGCGVVAAMDLLLYLKRYHSSETAKTAPPPLPLADYNERLERLNRRYFPLIPHFGINGLFLVAGINRLLKEEGLPYQARWVVSQGRLWERAESMLRRDLPVVLAIGPNFPAVWQKNRLDFYRRAADGSYHKVTATAAHYVTITGIDDVWLRISSWGVAYYINRSEYDSYVRRHSTYLFSNIVYLEKR